jgi:hypothetical protein
MKKGVNYIIILLLIISIFFPVDFVYAGETTVSEALGVIASWLGGGIELLLRPVFWAVQKILAGFAGLAGLILNSVIDFTIFRMSDNIQGLTGINIAWKVIKDLMNIGFIFMLVYQSILVILSIKDVSSVKSFIVGIFLASILINFSLFFTKVIIDASNVVTVGIYNNIVPGGAGQTLLTAGLANAYTQRLNIQSFYSADGASTATNWGQIMGYIGISIILIIVIFVFLAISVMFLVRYIVLLILLVLSPIAYMGLAWSGMKSYADRWWNAFWGQILWPPVYMIMTWVVLTIISDQGFLGKRPEYASLGGLGDGASAQDAASVIVNFALVIGLTIASVIVSKQTATKGASEVGKLTSGAMAFGGGALLGGAARLGRKTGRYGERMASDEDLKRRAAEEKGIKGSIARMQLAAANRVATGSYDVRASRVGETVIGQILGKEGFGKVAKDSNFRAIREAKIKEEAKIAERYKVSDRAKDEAKEKLDMNTLEGRKFDLEEKERKTKRRIYFGSDEFLNSSEKIKTDELAKESELEQRDIAREKAKIESDRASIEANKKEGGLGVLARLKNERDLAQGEKKAELDKEINDWEVNPDNQDLISGIKDQEDALREREKKIFQREEVDRVNQEKVKKFYKEKKELDDDKWVSQEKLRLVAVAGGTEVKDIQGEGKVTFIKDTNTRFNQNVVDAYTQRTEAVAQRAEEGSLVYRGVSNVYSRATGKKLKPTNYGKQLGKEIRKKSKGKTAEEQLRDWAKQKSKEEREAGRNFLQEESTSTPAPAPAPEPTPQPEQNAGGGGQQA